MSIFVTSDLHLNHNKDFIYEKRGFSNIDEHNKMIVQRWNDTVSNDDEVYLLGDVYMGNREQESLNLVSSLHGRIHLIRGNHDTDNKIQQLLELPNVINAKYANVIHFGKYRFYLSHYPAIVCDAKFGLSKIISLHGHTHHTDPFEFVEYGCYNVNVDAHNLTPVNIEKIRGDVCNELKKRGII